MRRYRVWRRGGTDTLSRVPCTCPFGATVVGSLRSSNHQASLAGAARGCNTAEILGYKYPRGSSKSDGELALRRSTGDQAGADRLRHCLGAIANSEASAGVGDVVVDRPLRQAKRRGDLHRSLAGGNPRQAFELPGSELDWRRGPLIHGGPDAAPSPCRSRSQRRSDAVPRIPASLAGLNCISVGKSSRRSRALCGSEPLRFRRQPDVYAAPYLRVTAELRKRAESTWQLWQSHSYSGGP